jgi:hypothetical protein
MIKRLICKVFGHSCFLPNPPMNDVGDVTLLCKRCQLIILKFVYIGKHGHLIVNKEIIE